MKKWLMILFFLSISRVSIAQEAVWEQIYDGDFVLNAYYFPESGKYLFRLQKKYRTDIDFADGSFDTPVVIFSGDAAVAKNFFDQLNRYLERPDRGPHTAVMIGDIIVQYDYSTWASRNELLLSDGKTLVFYDREGQKLCKAFYSYWEKYIAD